MNCESILVLSIPQIRLCMNVLGYDQWDDLPFIQTDEAPEQRLMNAFFGLIEMGKLIPEQEKYRMEPAFQEQMEMIGNAQRVYHLADGKQILAFFYEFNHSVMVLSPDWGKPGFCRIRQYSEISVQEIRDEYAALPDFGERVILLEADASEPEQYDMEKLMHFLDIPSRSEETI